MNEQKNNGKQLINNLSYVTVDPAYWYTEDDIEALLKLELKDNQEAYIQSAQFPLLAQAKGQAAQRFKHDLKQVIEQAIARKNTLPYLLPLNLVESTILDADNLPIDKKLLRGHWVLLIVKYQSDCDEIQIKYQDPQGNNVGEDIDATMDKLSYMKHYGEKWAKQIIPILRLIQNIDLKDAVKFRICVKGCVQQRNAADCGPWLIANAITEVSPKNQFMAPLELRKKHASLLPALLASTNLTMKSQPQGAMPKILRLAAVKEKTGYSRSSIYLKISQGVFPKPISLGPRAIGWLESEIVDWLEQRIQYSRQSS